MLTYLSRRTRLAPALLALGTLAGCPNPSGKLDEFENRPRTDGAVEVVADAGPDAMPLEMLPDINGEFLMGMAVSLSPSQPLWFRVTNDFTDNGDGTGTVDVMIQPLRYDGDHAAVGDVLIANDVVVNSAGQYTVVLTQAEIPGEANPITGNDLVGDFDIAGTIMSEDSACGTVSGMVTSPAVIDVEGTTFAITRIPASGMLPDLVSACP